MPSGHPLSTLRGTPLWLRGLALSTLGYIAWVSGYPTVTRWHRLIEIGFLTLLSAVASFTIWLASKRADLPPGYRSAARWLALAWVMALMAGLIFPFTDPIQTGGANLGLVDTVYLMGYPLTFIGLSRLPRASHPLPGLWRILLDSAAFIVGVGAPIWLFTIQPSLHRASDLAAFFTLLYPAMAFLGVMVLNIVLLRSEPFPSRSALNLLLAGIGTFWLTDLLFAWEINQSALPHLRYWVNISIAFGMFLVILGGWRIRTDAPPGQRLRPASVSPVPMLAIAFVVALLVPVLFTGTLNNQTIQKVLLWVVLLIFILLLRETLALGETTRHAAEMAGAEVQARYATLVRHSSDLVLVLNRQGDVTYASPVAEKVLGISAEAMVGRPLTVHLDPEDMDATRAFLQGLLLRPGTLIHRCRMQHSDGSARMLEISASNHLDDPTVHGCVLNARDITERHRLEGQLMEAQKMEAVGRLAGGVAHDFNNLLSAILGNAELAEIHLPEGHPAKRDLKRIYGAATRGAVLTNRLLSFCRHELPESKTIDPIDLVKGVLPLLEGLLGERIRLVLNLEPGTWPITIDPNELEQALLNMAANARDAMPNGGRLTLTLHNLQVTETQITPYLPIAAGDSVALEVTDTGTGMDEATLQHLFEPFFTTKSRGKGTGLGLASVYGLVKAGRGGIDIRSAPGQGTTLRLVFPRSTEEPEKAKPRPGLQPIRGWETILLVEDEQAVRETTERCLVASGYNVLAAANAEEARLTFRNSFGEVHVLLTDVIMPGDSGPALAAELVNAHPALRVLYMSGYTANELGPHGLARPDAPLLRKPFTVAQLTHRLRMILAGPPGQL